MTATSTVLSRIRLFCLLLLLLLLISIFIRQIIDLIIWRKRLLSDLSGSKSTMFLPRTALAFLCLFLAKEVVQLDVVHECGGLKFLVIFGSIHPLSCGGNVRDAIF